VTPMNLFRKSKSEAPNAPAETTPAVAWADVVPLRAEHAPGSAFNVRGANYLKDKVKVPSAEPIYLFERAVALRAAEGKVCAEEIFAQLRREGRIKDGYSESELPELMIVNCQVPFAGPAMLRRITEEEKKDPGWSALSYFRKSDAPVRAEEKHLLTRLLEQKTSRRDAEGAAFKIIGKTAEPEKLGVPNIGGIVDKWNGKPFNLDTTTRVVRDQNAFVVEIDMRQWSYVAKKALNSAMNSETSRDMTYELGFLIEAASEGDLPERLLAAHYVHGVNITKLERVELTTQPSTEYVSLEEEGASGASDNERS